MKWKRVKFTDVGKSLWRAIWRRCCRVIHLSSLDYPSILRHLALREVVVNEDEERGGMGLEYLGENMFCGVESGHFGRDGWMVVGR